MQQKIKTIKDFQNIIDNKANWVFCQYFNGLEWMRLCSSARPSVEFVEEFIHKIIFYSISKNKLLAKPIIDKYSDKLDWRLISHNHVLNSYFVNTYLDRLNLEVVLDRVHRITAMNLKEDTLCCINEHTLKVVKFTLELDWYLKGGKK